MVIGESLRESIHEANIAVHRFEAEYYELFHPEVYSNQEQKRISSVLNLAHKLVVDNQQIALDFGAGTGNLTGKLLRLGYKVTAIKIDPYINCDAGTLRPQNMEKYGLQKMVEK